MRSGETRAELRRRLTGAIPNVSQGPVPTFDIATLSEERALQGFFEAMRWAFDDALRAG